MLLQVPTIQNKQSIPILEQYFLPVWKEKLPGESSSRPSQCEPHPPEPPEGPDLVFTLLCLWTCMCLVHMHMDFHDTYLLTKAASAHLHVSEVCDHARLSSAPVSDCGCLCISGSLCILLLRCSEHCLNPCVGVHLHTYVSLCCYYVHCVPMPVFQCACVYVYKSISVCMSVYVCFPVTM